jgi:DNA-binding transcriptional LysR family regulator
MLEQIRSFLTVVEEGNLHRAAARLHISQSTLSRQMQILELELGGRLLERMATGVRPTAGGQALAEKMGALLASYDQAERLSTFCSLFFFMPLDMQVFNLRIFIQTGIENVLYSDDPANSRG